MNTALKNIARVGYISKGLVYGITGILTFLAAFHLGGKKAGKMEVIKFLDEQPFGAFLIILLAAGVLCYAIWRFKQAFSDTEHKGKNAKGKFTRVGYFISGLLYLGLAVAAFLHVLGSGGSSSDSTKSSFLATETGLVLIAIAGVALVASGIRQFIKVYNKKFLEEFDLSSLSDENSRKSIVASARFGLAARGVIFLITGFFAVKAALDANPDEIKSTKEVFSFIEEAEYGAWLLGTVAAGLVAYAFHMFLVARYRKFS
ncbi:MAG TPA: DUF1206 domain-containing protein [Flavobacterium sp.]|jgi:uncharacterized membrane protein YidH (DUF202 family)